MEEQYSGSTGTHNLMYRMYILYSTAFDEYYIGSTNDVEKRLQRRNSSKFGWTKSYRPWILLHTETFASRSEAVQREKCLKSLKDKNLIKQYIAGWRSSTSSGS